ncbi:MAG: hypothetical protein KUG78_05940 [Kangiellaceae bacterium]|nr:hypothetical protein [Kangiellaceae bacterium]
MAKEYLNIMISKVFQLSVGLFCLITFAAKAEVDLFLFSEVRTELLEGNAGINSAVPSLDLFLSADSDSFSILAEYFLSENVQHTERFQIGYQTSESSQLWLGRFHNPIGFWHTEYHHGNFLQTGISRPGMVKFGGDGGIVSGHLSGGLFDIEIASDESLWQYSVAVGLAAKYQTSGHSHQGEASASLSDFDIFSPNSDEHELGYTAKLTYTPSIFEETKIGVSYSKFEVALESMDLDLDHESEEVHENINIDLLGLFINYQQHDYRVISELFYMQTKVPEHHEIIEDSFLNLYVQLEYTASSRLTPYVRLEDSFGHKDNAYLALFEKNTVSAQVVGIRWELANEHAIKLEYSNSEVEAQSEDRLLLNWTAVFP